MLRELPNCSTGNGIERDRPQQAHFDARDRACRATDFQNARHDAVAHQHDVRILRTPQFRADLLRSICLYFSSSLQYVLLPGRSGPGAES